MKKAMTFLEILMAIIIIGIISGFLISQIKPKKTINASLIYSSFASIREYAIQLMAKKGSDNIKPLEEGITVDPDFKYDSSPSDLYFYKDKKKLEKADGTGEDDNPDYDGQNSHFCIQFADLINTKSKINCRRNNKDAIMLTNGIEIKGLADDWKDTTYKGKTLNYKILTIDIDGFNKGTKISWEENPRKADQFKVILYNDGTIQPVSGARNTDVAKFKVLDVANDKYLTKNVNGKEEVTLSYCNAVYLSGYAGNGYGNVKVNPTLEGACDNTSDTYNPNCSTDESCKIILLPDNVTSMLGGVVTEEIEY